MLTVEVAILAIVQGITEFLPVSSSGHLLLARLLLNLSDAQGIVFDTFLHLGTLGAVLIYFWRTWWDLGRSLFKSNPEANSRRGLIAKLVIATLPAALVGYFFADVIAKTMQGSLALALSFVGTAIILWLAESQINRTGSDAVHAHTQQFEQLSFMSAFFIGVWQAVALVPGISRSATTIAAGRWRNLSRQQATTFSFLLSAPIIAGAGLHSLPEIIRASDFAPSQLILGLVLSFLSGLGAIHLLLKLIKTISLRPFAVYLVIVAGAIFFYG